MAGFMNAQKRFLGMALAAKKRQLPQTPKKVEQGAPGVSQPPMLNPLLKKRRVALARSITGPSGY